MVFNLAIEKHLAIQPPPPPSIKQVSLESPSEQIGSIKSEDRRMKGKAESVRELLRFIIPKYHVYLFIFYM